MFEVSIEVNLEASNLSVEDLRKRIKKLLHRGIGIEKIRVAFLESLKKIGYDRAIIQSALDKFDKVKLEIYHYKKRKKYRI